MIQALTPIIVLALILITGLSFIKYYEWKESKKKKFPDFPKAGNPGKHWRDNSFRKI